MWSIEHQCRFETYIELSTHWHHFVYRWNFFNSSRFSNPRGKSRWMLTSRKPWCSVVARVFISSDFWQKTRWQINRSSIWCDTPHHRVPVLFRSNYQYTSCCCIPLFRNVWISLDTGNARALVWNRCKIVRNTAIFRANCRRLEMKHFDGRVEFFPIEWRSKVRLDGDMVECITPKKVRICQF